MRVRFIAPWKGSTDRPVIYHCVSRGVDRRFAFAAMEKEQLRTYMRMYENFSGCRVLAYCFMYNHIHLLLEVPPMAVGGLSDEGVLKRLRAIYNELEVAARAKELREYRKRGMEAAARDLHERFTYRMHDLSEFMKGFMQRFTQWFNRERGRKGGLWEDAFKSVLVEEGTEKLREEVDEDGRLQVKVVRKGMKKEVAAEEMARLERRRDYRDATDVAVSGAVFFGWAGAREP